MKTIITNEMLEKALEGVKINGVKDNCSLAIPADVTQEQFALAVINLLERGKRNFTQSLNFHSEYTFENLIAKKIRKPKVELTPEELATKKAEDKVKLAAKKIFDKALMAVELCLVSWSASGNFTTKCKNKPLNAVIAELFLHPKVGNQDVLPENFEAKIAGMIAKFTPKNLEEIELD